MPTKKLRGARPSPKHVLAGATPHKFRAAPLQFADLAPKIDDWGNLDHGDCVSAEEASAKAKTIFLPNDVVIAWAQAHGVLEGAVISDVLGWMATEGIAYNGVTYKDGPASSVDWTNFGILSSAIAEGQVKVGIAAAQLQTAVESTNDASGWFLTGAQKDQNLDHCTGVAGYGTASYCAGAVGAWSGAAVSVPNGVDPSTPAVIMFTWKTYGVVDLASLVAICGEAWVRTPTTEPTDGPPPPPPPPPPTGIIDAVNKGFAALEAMYSRWPAAVAELKAVQKLLVAWLQKNNYGAGAAQAALAAGFPPQVVKIIDAGLDAILASPGGAKHAVIIAVVRGLIDKFLPMI
jgi:hypothetical protein